MPEIKTPYDAVARGKEIFRQLGYSHGKASVVVSGRGENFWEITGCTIDFIDIKMIIDSDGFLKQFVANNDSDKKKAGFDPEKHNEIPPLELPHNIENLKYDKEVIVGILPSMELELEDQMIFCSYCNTLIDIDNKFCRKCGNTISIPEPKPLIEKNDEIEELNYKAYSLSESQKFEESLIYYDKALEIDNSSIITLFNKADTLYRFEKYQKALVCYDDILKIKPKSIRTIYKKGLTLQSLEKHDNALTCFKNILKFDPENTMALNCKGIELGHLGKIREEITCYEKILEINPNDFCAIENKKTALEKLPSDSEI